MDLSITVSISDARGRDRESDVSIIQCHSRCVHYPIL